MFNKTYFYYKLHIHNVILMILNKFIIYYRKSISKLLLFIYYFIHLRFFFILPLPISNGFDINNIPDPVVFIVFLISILSSSTIKLSIHFIYSSFVYSFTSVFKFIDF
jgi:hypothetical protein